MCAYAHHTLGVDEKVELCTIDRFVPFHRQVVTDTQQLDSGHAMFCMKIPLMYSQKRNCVALAPNFHIHVAVSDL